DSDHSENDSVLVFSPACQTKNDPAYHLIQRERTSVNTKRQRDENQHSPSIAGIPASMKMNRWIRIIKSTPLLAFVTSASLLFSSCTKKEAAAAEARQEVLPLKPQRREPQSTAAAQPVVVSAAELSADDR